VTEPLTAEGFERTVKTIVAEMKQADSAWTEYVAEPTPRFRAHVTFLSGSGKNSWEAFFDFDPGSGDFFSCVTPYLWAKVLDKFHRKVEKRLSAQRP